MTMTDPIADTLTRIRNGYRANRTTVSVHKSKIVNKILDVLIKEGYIDSTLPSPIDSYSITVHLKYVDNVPAIRKIDRLSKPSKRQYGKPSNFHLHTNNNTGIIILSTSRGVISNRVASKLGIGGELICKVF